ncbi:MAG: putative nucleotidyltransferase [Microgenomates group bacterium GW2011_GWC1_37_8]|uniref:Putative nucleotidyltransferase n=1 Tax=Candidatus Woesebacteria bacterium GW2011_GWB1_38_8 TaxID=1618570 RepID=A0A0G0KZA5_9BACT|nr:MAG: putative nucleotidyltransferase [Microgenomates group bacterium GW2011_GWC1_37_8]KKQ85018.1 MAG: putative nucleotidyltransferase [Candidatus Woesebacteria bacterium GW2011_GWB1_38_8]
MKNPISQNTINKIRSLLASEKEIISAYVFGSRAKGKETKSSDLDIGILCLEKSAVNQRRLATDIQKLISGTETDVVLADLSNNPLLLIQIINGNLIYEKNSRERTNLESRVLFSYEDSKHFRNIKKFYLEKSFKEGIYAY